MTQDNDPIPLLDLRAQHGALMPELQAAFARIVDTGQFIMGPELAALEKELAAFIRVPHTVGVSSGTDALLVALMALDVGPGDEVITTPFSFFATAGCVARLGATPVFVDVDPVSYNLNVEGVAEAITERTKVLLPVHLYGQCCDMEPLLALAKTHSLHVLEDAAQALGATYRGKPAGSLGAAGCFSFFPSKNLGAMGDAGLVSVSDDALADRIRMLRAHGSKPKYHHHEVGGNFRLDHLQAALLRVKLPHLEDWTAARRSNAARYDQLFGQAGLPPQRLSAPPREEGHCYHQYVIRTDRRDGLRAHLKQQQIGCDVYYPGSLSLQPCFKHLGYKPGDFPVTERAAQEVLALPIYPELPPAHLQRVASTVVDYLRGA